MIARLVLSPAISWFTRPRPPSLTHPEPLFPSHCSRATVPEPTPPFADRHIRGRFWRRVEADVTVRRACWCGRAPPGPARERPPSAAEHRSSAALHRSPLRSTSVGSEDVPTGCMSTPVDLRLAGRPHRSQRGHCPGSTGTIPKRAAPSAPKFNSRTTATSDSCEASATTRRETVREYDRGPDWRQEPSELAYPAHRDRSIKRPHPTRPTLDPALLPPLEDLHPPTRRARPPEDHQLATQADLRTDATALGRRDRRSDRADRQQSRRGPRPPARRISASAAFDRPLAFAVIIVRRVWTYRRDPADFRWICSLSTTMSWADEGYGLEVRDDLGAEVGG